MQKHGEILEGLRVIHEGVDEFDKNKAQKMAKTIFGSNWKFSYKSKGYGYWSVETNPDLKVNGYFRVDNATTTSDHVVVMEIEVKKDFSNANNEYIKVDDKLVDELKALLKDLKQYKEGNSTYTWSSGDISCKDAKEVESHMKSYKMLYDKACKVLA